MTTKLQQQKFEKVFERYDSDRNGRIDQADIDALVQSWCASFDAAPGSVKWRQITAQANKLWQEISGHLDTNGDKVVSKDEWVAAHTDAGFVEKAAIPLALAAFDLGDIDGDGKVSLNEWMTAQTAAGVSQVEAAQTFQSLDVDGDGFITRDEHAKAIREFYEGDDRSAVGSHLAGRL